MSILIVTGIEGIQQCANNLASVLGTEVVTADGKKEAVAALKRREFVVVVLDDTLAECDPAAAEAIWENAGLAIPLQINFALSGATRLSREIRAAMRRRDREQALARQAAESALEGELKNTLASLLLHSQIALAGSEASSPVTEKIRTMAKLAGNLRQQLSSSLRAGGGAAA